MAKQKTAAPIIFGITIPKVFVYYSVHIYINLFYYTKMKFCISL